MIARKSIDDPASPHFSISVGSNGYFVVGLHPYASRPARRFPYPAMAFNLSAQFEALRKEGRFAAIQTAVRKRDRQLAGDLNPILADHGHGAEAPQYSARAVVARRRIGFPIENAKRMPGKGAP